MYIESRKNGNNYYVVENPDMSQRGRWRPEVMADEKMTVFQLEHSKDLLNY